MRSVATQPIPLAQPEVAEDRWPQGCSRPGARARRATVRRRLGQATDVLALADLLLALNVSMSSLDEERK